jgi:hypothetical protein
VVRYLAELIKISTQLCLHLGQSYALVILVRPFKLDGVVADLLGLPGTNVSYLPVVVIIPTLSCNRIRDSFTQFMRAGCGKRVERLKTTHAACTVRIGHAEAIAGLHCQTP